MLKAASSFLLLLILAQSATAQNITKGSISGLIKDVFGKPIHGATISIPNANLATSSDIDGYYKLSTEGVSADALLQVTALGFSSFSEPINGRTILDIQLKEDRNAIQEVLVSGIAKTENERKVAEIKRSGFNVSVIDMNTYANHTANINQILSRAPGITFREDGGLGSNFIFRINGLAARIYIDGVPMDNFGSSMSLNNIPVNLVDRIEIYKGVVPAFLGSDALGGAVNIITKQRSRHFLDLSYSIGSFNTHQAALVGMYTNPKNKLSVRSNAFYNYSDNNYDMYSMPAYGVVYETTVNNKFVPVDRVKRFNDRYYSAMGQLEVGLRDKSWTDQFFIGLTYSANNKQNQLGPTISSVYGGNWRLSNYIMPTVNYKKQDFLVKRLYTDIYASLSYDIANIRDTAMFNYNWSGGWVSNENGASPRVKKHEEQNSTNVLARANFNYDFDEERNHSLNLNYNINRNNRQTYDRMIDFNTSGLPSNMVRHIVGLSWQNQWFNKRLVNNLALKLYGLDTYKELDERILNAGEDEPQTKRVGYSKNFSYLGYSFASRYRVLKDAGVKFSAERAYNMPSMTALFGDGQNQIANWDIKPERSDNLNGGVYYNSFFNENHFINFDLSGFYRLTDNYLNTRIVSSGGEAKFQAYNIPGVRLYGAETEVRYGFKDMITVAVNASYDKAIDNVQYTDDSNQEVSLTYGYQIPNRPWVYGNLDVGFAKNDWFQKGSRTQLNWTTQYTHWYYLSDAHLGSLASKNFIPSQTVHSLILSYSWNRNKYNIAGEVRNLTNERAFDNFRLQKPGRAFYLKLRVSLM